MTTVEVDARGRVSEVLGRWLDALDISDSMQAIQGFVAF